MKGLDPRDFIAPASAGSDDVMVYGLVALAGLAALVALVVAGVLWWLRDRWRLRQAQLRAHLVGQAGPAELP